MEGTFEEDDKGRNLVNEVQKECFRKIKKRKHREHWLDGIRSSMASKDIQRISEWTIEYKVTLFSLRVKMTTNKIMLHLNIL